MTQSLRCERLSPVADQAGDCHVTRLSIGVDMSLNRDTRGN